jgi:hypothetical protein
LLSSPGALTVTGLLLLIAAAGWVIFVVRTAKKAGTLLRNRVGNGAVSLAVFLLLLPLPLIDEIIGGRQFSELCKKNVVHVNSRTARGRTVYLEHASQSPVKGKAVRTWVIPQRFVDSSTGELVLSYDILRAEGGALLPSFDAGNEPLTFKGECHPAGTFEKSFLPNLGIARIKNPNADPFVLK